MKSSTLKLGKLSEQTEPMRPSSSLFFDVRGLKYHIREWGNKKGKPLFLLHGWMDVSASFQFTVEHLSRDWRVLAPDWRGFGLSEWTKTEYWFQDYVADFNCIVEKLAPTGTISLVGHSMGGNIAGIFAGVRPDKISRLVLAEGFAIRPINVNKSPERYMKWFDCIKSPKRLRPYSSFSDVVKRLITNTPNIDPKNAEFLALHWAHKTESGTIELRADPKHKHPSPALYQSNEALSYWKRIKAPVMWIHSDSSWLKNFMKNQFSEIDVYRKAFDKLTETTIKESSHMMHLDQPKKFARTIENFLID